MKMLRNTLLALGLAASTALANASPIVLDFEGAKNGLNLENFYNGGLGFNYGIFFSLGAYALVDADVGGTGNFANEPSPDTVLFFLDTDKTYLNSEIGFTEAVSFFYSSVVPITVRVYDDLSGAGNELASFGLDAQFDTGCIGDPSGLLCNFNSVSLSFVGTARSIDFGAQENQTAFDNITLNLLIPGDGGNNDVPEPATLALLGLALAGLGATRRWGMQRRR